MTEYSWHATYTHAVELFHDTPHADTEGEILEAFQEAPRFVTDQIEQIATAVAAGRVRSGWAVLRKRISQGPRADITVIDTNERDKRIRGALTWISNAGLHYSSQRDLEATLFEDGYGEHGQNLRAWADDTELRQRMTDTWHKVRTKPQKLDTGIRPSGEELERLDHDYYTRLKTYRERTAALEAERARILRETLDAKQAAHATAA